MRAPLLVLIVLAIFYTTYAFASSNSGFAPGGEGVNAISGWVVSNVNYRLSEDSSKIAAVEFDLDSPATVVKASINSSNSVLFSCVNSGATHWICNTNQEDIASADALKVIASGN
jgi:hypothetical protein